MPQSSFIPIKTILFSLCSLTLALRRLSSHLLLYTKRYSFSKGADCYGLEATLKATLEASLRTTLGPNTKKLLSLVSSPRNFMFSIAQLIKAEILDSNIFSLRLSRNPGDREGQLVFGGIVDKRFYNIPNSPNLNVFSEGDM
ncbi:hypothetical protein DL98DRAFT_541280 [Cadophora sp. DSE1049]|nr:hypothetical protein DL98DRAFT_541280 [Cadophora sp. DSE1049]